jgi:hypothetical protein
VLAEPNPLDGTNMDVFADLLVLPSGAVGLTIDTRVEEDNSPIYNAGAMPGGSGTTTIKLQRIVNGSVADDLATVYVVGTDDAFLSAEDLNGGIACASTLSSVIFIACFTIPATNLMFLRPSSCPTSCPMHWLLG